LRGIGGQVECLFHLGATGQPHASAQLGVAGELEKGSRERLGILLRDQDPPLILFSYRLLDLHVHR